jgi:hypothetical protein
MTTTTEPLAVRREIALPGDEAFYVTQRGFPVSVAAHPCSLPPVDDEGNKLSLAVDPSMKPLLAGWDGKRHRASVAEITAAAMRFYRTGGIDFAAHAAYEDVLFLWRHDFGHVFAATGGSGNSIGPWSAERCGRHSETVKKSVEMFGYGLAVHFAAHLLGVPLERFFFTAAAGKRPDFAAKVTAAELTAAGATTKVLNADGKVVQLEVKAQTSWRTYSKGKAGRDMARDLALKAQACGDSDIFLGVVVGLPGRSDRPRGATRLLVVDPGEARVRDRGEQAVIVLREHLFMAYRLGLWIVARDLLRWLAELRVELTANEATFRAIVERRYPELADQPFLTQRPGPADRGEMQGRRGFVGRVFNSTLERLGAPGRRAMSVVEAERVVRLGLVGENWFRGLDATVARLASARSAEALEELIDYGVRGRSDVDLSGESAFWAERESVSPDEVREVLGAVARDLDRYRRTGTW